MKMKSLTISTYEITTGKEKSEIAVEEYEKINQILSSGQSKGFIRLKNGEWINLAYVVKIKPKEIKNRYNF